MKDKVMYEKLSEAMGLLDEVTEVMKGRASIPTVAHPPALPKNRFLTCLPRILRHEGGFVNHPSDPGGATNKGITIGTARRFFGQNFSVEQLRNITDNQVEYVYHHGYWNINGWNLSGLPVGLDYVVFDSAINSGPTRAVIWLQRVIGVADDGVLGPITMGKATESALPTTGFINAYLNMRLGMLKRLSTWDVFGRGWTTRVERVRKDAVLDAEQA